MQSSVLRIVSAYLSLLVFSTGLPALTVGYHVGTWWENLGDGKSDSLGVHWGFQTEQLDANFSLTKIELESGHHFNVANLHFELRSPVFELGTLSPPEYWSCLSNSVSGLEAIRPGYQAAGKKSEWIGHQLPLSLLSLSRADPARVIGLGLGYPRLFSGIVFRNISGANAGWDHLGLMGQVPFSGGSGFQEWTAKLGLAWYHSWLQSPISDGTWISAQDGSGLLVRQSANWWLGGDFLRPQAIDHSQIVFSFTNYWLHLVILGQESTPILFDSGTTIGFSATLLFHQLGELAMSVDLSGAHAITNYRDSYGQKTPIQDAISCAVLWLPWKYLGVKLGVDWGLGRIPDIGDYAARFQTTDLNWQGGINYTIAHVRAGIELKGQRKRDPCGIVAQNQALGVSSSFEFAAQGMSKLGIHADLEMHEWQVQNFKVAPILNLGWASGIFSGNIGIELGLNFPLVPTISETMLAVRIKGAIAVMLGSGYTVEMRLSLSLPECPITQFSWSSLARRIEISFNP